MSIVDKFKELLGIGGGEGETTASIVANTVSSGFSSDDKPDPEDNSKEDKLSQQILRYPLDVEGDYYPHSVNFRINLRNSVEASGGNGTRGSGTQLGDSITNNPDGVATSMEDAFGLAINTSIATVGSRLPGGLLTAAGLVVGAEGSGLTDELARRATNLVQMNTTRQTKSIITLAQTASPNMKNEAQWDSTDFGLLGMLLESGGLNNMAAALKTKEGGEFALRQVASLANIGKQMGVNLPLEATLEVTSSKVANPFKEQLFKTMNFRSFDFNHIFAPRNKEELRQVLRIINEFEFYMHPEKDKSQLFLKYPAEFEIEYRYRGNKNSFINQIQTCALTGMNVDYGSGGMMSGFKDMGGAPSEIKLTLQFKELVLRERGMIRHFSRERAAGGEPPTGPATGQETQVNENGQSNSQIVANPDTN